jgi:heat shock protein HtpX
MNNVKTVLLLGGLTGLFIFIGGMIGGQTGMIIALIVAGLMNFVAYWYSDTLVLKMHNAQPVSESQAPDIHRMVTILSQRAGIPKPRVCIVEDSSPNAFATGRNPERGVVALSTGLIKLMNRDELEGVIAHELSHIKHRDTLISSVAATIAGAIMVLASMMRFFAIFGFGGDDDDGGENILVLLIMAIVAPIAAMIIQMAISRSREYKADLGAATLTRNPNGLASSLEKLGYYSQRIPMHGNSQTAHLFIVNPLSGKSFANLFATHPPIEDRVERLRSMRGY